MALTASQTQGLQWAAYNYDHLAAHVDAWKKPGSWVLCLDIRHSGQKFSDRTYAASIATARFVEASKPSHLVSYACSRGLSRASATSEIVDTVRGIKVVLAKGETTFLLLLVGHNDIVGFDLAAVGHIRREQISAISCAWCGQQGAVKRCAKCSAVVYCGPACQRAHWSNGHKRQCYSLQTTDPSSKSLSSSSSSSEAPQPVLFSEEEDNNNNDDGVQTVG